jgi:hypothetical protein
LAASRATPDDFGVDEIDRRLMQRIELGEWSRLVSVEEWKWRAATELFLTPQELDRRIEKVKNLRGLHWSEHQGTYVFDS